MDFYETRFGRILVGERDDLFAHKASLLRQLAQDASDLEASVGLTGGSTPKAFYQWAVDGQHLTEPRLRPLVWSVSDERHTPLDSDESNFGNARRLLLEPLGIPPGNHLPWPVHYDPEAAAEIYLDAWRERFGPERAYDLCFAGMGDDNHTLSLFPGSRLIRDNPPLLFAAVEVPGKGWRLTLTPSGLHRCAHIVLTVTGEAKARPLRKVFTEPLDVAERPVQLLAEHAERTTWLIDPPAATGLHNLL